MEMIRHQNIDRAMLPIPMTRMKHCFTKIDVETGVKPIRMPAIHHEGPKNNRVPSVSQRIQPWQPIVVTRIVRHLEETIKG
jgi:hypothetical protein